MQEIWEIILRLTLQIKKYTLKSKFNVYAGNLGENILNLEH
jgi:hypothetical protein